MKIINDRHSFALGLQAGVFLQAGIFLLLGKFRSKFPVCHTCHKIYRRKKAHTKNKDLFCSYECEITHFSKMMQSRGATEIDATRIATEFVMGPMQKGGNA